MYPLPNFSQSIWSLAKSLVDRDQKKILGCILERKSSIEEVLPSYFLTEIPPEITDKEYIRNVILTSLFLSRFYQGEKLSLPLIDDERLSKEDAVPYIIWGMLYDDWEPTKEDGLSVFFQGYAQRGLNNYRKRIYFSAVTPDLYPSKYQGKVVSFFSQLLDCQNANKPLMRLYLNSYFNLYWDLHLGVTPEEIPQYVIV